MLVSTILQQFPRLFLATVFEVFLRFSSRNSQRGRGTAVGGVAISRLERLLLLLRVFPSPPPWGFGFSPWSCFLVGAPLADADGVAWRGTTGGLSASLSQATSTVSPRGK